MNNYYNMNEELDINQTNDKKEKLNEPKINISNLKKDILKNNSLLNYVSIIENSPLFNILNMKKWEILFNEWSIDNNLYIVKKWILSVEKYISEEKIEAKQLATLKTGDFFWEASLSLEIKNKESSIKALEDCTIISIDAKNDLKKFVEENPNIWYEILKHIVTQTNERLLESNKLIAINWEIDKEIKSLNIIDIKSIFNLIDKIKNIWDVDYIVYIEKHQVLENFFIIKYDSRQKNKMLDIVIEKVWNFLNLRELYKEANISEDDFLIVNKLNIWNEIYWYLIFWREQRSFSWSDKKIFSSISNSFVWVLKSFFLNKDLKNKIYIKEQKK